MDRSPRALELLFGGFARSSPRRSLFGPTDPAEFAEMCSAALPEIYRAQSRRWNFDFLNMCPLPGQYQWEPVEHVESTRTDVVNDERLYVLNRHDDDDDDDGEDEEEEERSGSPDAAIAAAAAAAAAVGGGSGGDSEGDRVEAVIQAGAQEPVAGGIEPSRPAQGHLRQSLLPEHMRSVRKTPTSGKHNRSLDPDDDRKRHRKD